MHLSQLVAAAIAVAIGVLAWPAPLGGATSYVVVSGVSMEPTYESGDLVVTRRADGYDVGDVIAFRTEDGDVIHRIVGGNDVDGYRTQGDNVARFDPYRPRPADVRGRAVLHLPVVGAWGLRLVQTVPAPLLAAGAVLFALGGERGRRRGGRAGGRDRPREGTEDLVGATPMQRPRVRTAAVAVVAAAVVLPSAVLAWRAPVSVDVPAEQAEVRHELAVTLVGLTDRPSTLYPDRRSAPIGPGEDGGVDEDAPTLVRRQVDELLVTVRHAAVGQQDVRGAGRVDVVLRTGSGFEVPLDGVPMTQFTDAFDAEVTVDLDEVDQRHAAHLEESGLATDTVTVEVRPLVATDDGVTLRPSPVVITPRSDVIAVDGSLRTVTTPDGDVTTVPATAALVGLPAPVTTVRLVATTAVAVLLGLAGLLLRRELRERPDVRIGLLHGSVLVDVAPDANVGGELVRVTSIAELVRLARHDRRPVLHQERVGGRHHYLVPDGDLTYEYVVDVDGAQVGGPGIEVPADAAAIDPVQDTAPAPSEATSPVEDVSAVAPGVPSVHDTVASASGGSAPVGQRRIVDLDALARVADPAPAAAAPAAPAGDGVLDYLPVAPADLPAGRVVVVEDFTELTRIWMQDNAAPGRLHRRRLAGGGMRYSVVRSGREFVHEARPDEVGGAGDGSGHG